MKEIIKGSSKEGRVKGISRRQEEAQGTKKKKRTEHRNKRREVDK